MSIKKYNKNSKDWEVIGASSARAVAVSNPKLQSKDMQGAINEIVDEQDTLKKNVAWIYKNGTIGGGGGGGGTPAASGVIETNLLENPHYVGTNETLVVEFKVTSRLPTNFNITLKLDNKASITRSVKPNTWQSWNLGVLSKGSHTAFISGLDADMMPIDNVTLTIVAGVLDISSTFNDRAIFNVASDIEIPFLISSYLTSPINIESSVNLTPQPTQVNVPKDITQMFKLGKRPVGVYNVDLQAISSGYVSNKLSYTINVASTSELFLSAGANIQKTYNIGIPIKFAYSVAVLGYTAFAVSYSIAGKTGTMNAVVGTNLFEMPTDGLPPGDHELVLTARDIDSTIFTAEPLVIPIKITSVDFAPWPPVQDKLVAHFKARGLDASQTNLWPNSVEGSQVTCQLHGFNGSSNGFVSVDPNDIGKSLVINGEAYAEIQYQPFQSQRQVLTNGVTISFLYRTKNIGNQKARVIDCGSYVSGQENLLYGFYTDTQECHVRTNRTSTTAKVAEDEWINQTVVIDQKFLKVYNNGVITAVSKHGEFGTDVVDHDGKIYLGARKLRMLVNNQETDVMTDFADCEIKDVKIYSGTLSPEQVVYNYVGDDYYLHTKMVDGALQYDADKQKALRELNSMDEQGNFRVDTSATAQFPILEIKFTDNGVAKEFREYSERTVWANTVDKFKQFPCIINYTDHRNKRYLSNRMGYIYLQGTSSTGYTSKNYEVAFGKMNDGLTDYIYSPKEDWLPENSFTLKCNMMDSSHANNIGTGRLINNGYFRDPIPPKRDLRNANRTKVKDAIDGFPVIMEIAMGRTNGSGDEDNYMGIYTFNMGRKSYYNLGLKNLSYTEVAGEVQAYTEDPTGLYDPKNVFAWEVATSNNDGAGAFKQHSDDWMRSDFSRIFPVTDSADAYTAIKHLVQKTSKAGPPVITTDPKDNTPILDPQGNPIYTESGLQFGEIGVWNIASLADYLILAYVLGMVDNLGKNLLLKTWERMGDAAESQWYTTFYDCDTILGLSNVGIIANGPDVDIDKYPTGDFMVDTANPKNRGGGNYNLSDSRLWELYRQNYYRFETSEEKINDSFNLLQRYTNLRKAGILTYENIIEKYMSVINSIGQNYYNRDAEIKYLNYVTGADNTMGYHNLNFLHGTREHYTKQWVKKRIAYLDSLFDCSDNNIAGNTSAQGLKMRFNGRPGNRILDVQTYSPVFMTVQWKGEDDKNDYNKVLVDGSTPRRFQKEFSAMEQSTNINFGPEVMYINNLNVGNPSYLDLRYARNLLKLDLSGNSFLQDLNLDGCVGLRDLDLRNCTKLGKGTAEDSRSYIDVRNCLNLQTIDISSTALSQVNLPTGGTLKSFRCTNSMITSIDLSNQSFLEEVDLSNCTNLNRIILKNCANLKSIILENTALTEFEATQCPNLTTVILKSNRYLKSLNFSGTDRMEHLDVTYCNNVELSTLNLVGCPKLVSLIMEGCAARLVRFPNQISTLTAWNCRNSSIEQTQFGGAGADMFGTKPAVNMSQLAGIPTIDFYNCKNLINVININTKLTSKASVWYNCSNLERITGTLELAGSASSMFNGCSKLILNPEVKSGGKTVVPSTSNASFPFKLILSAATSLNSAFAACKSLTYYDVMFVLRRLSSSCTALNATFHNCDGITTTVADPLNKAMFETATHVRDMGSLFYLCNNMGGPLDADLIAKQTRVTSVYRLFCATKVTDFPQSFFYYNTEITTMEQVFSGASLSGSVYGKNIFVSNTKLTNLDRAFSGNTNLSVILEDDTLFRFNPNLVNISYVFNGCKVTGNLHANLFGGVQATGSGVEEGRGNVTYRYPTKITNLAYAFNNTSLTGPIPAKLFAALDGLEQAGAFIAGTQIGGEIPAGLFINNPSLISVESFFSGLSGLSGSIPETLLHNNKNLNTVASLFSGCSGLSGEIPATLLKYCPKIVSVSNLFNGCYRLSGSIPGTLFATYNDLGMLTPMNVTTNATGIFRSCYGLSGSIPGELFQNMPGVETLADVFSDCGSYDRINQYGLTGPIPRELFKGLYSLKSLSNTFSKCTKLSPTIIPDENPTQPDKYFMFHEDLLKDLSQLQVLSGTFNTLSSNRYDIPARAFVNNPNILEMNSTFYNTMGEQVLDKDLFKFQNRLRSITSIFSNESADGSGTWTKAVPEGLFTKYTSNASGISGQPLTNVTGAFAKNTAITGTAPAFWNFGTVTERANCFRNCTKLANYDAIPAEYK